MANIVTLECRICGTLEDFSIQEFLDYVTTEPHTRINSEDSGALHLELHICAICLEDER